MLKSLIVWLTAQGHCNAAKRSDLAFKT